ncbi:hypothetical protein DOFOFD_00935 [Acetobacteraceae bacterium EV16P]|uniref:Fluoride ion transporter CrcB n=1 Tax=Sorlinia euscelidii TaxID=3081148 RepID=A0ABU7U153_9PROT
MSFISCLLVMIGGAIGTLGRFLVGYASRSISHEFPWGLFWASTWSDHLSSVFSAH